MDRVRLGRVLGRGARMAARTVYDAVDAATTPAPGPAKPQVPSVAPVRPGGSGASGGGRSVSAERSVQKPAGGHAPLKQALQGAAQVHGAAQAARRGVLAPVKRASRSLALEITGSFFGLFALSFAVAVWRARRQWGDSATHGRLAVYALLAAVFLYFAVSNFVKASRIQRG